MSRRQRPFALATAGLALVVASLGSGAGGGPRVAHAQRMPITDRNYAIDLYQGAILGASRVVGMGGASLAAAEAASGMTTNPASPAVRIATSQDRWDWDWNADWMFPQLGSDDFDNNGDRAPEIDETLIGTGGILVQYGKWAFGVSVNLQSHVVSIDNAGGGAPAQAEISWNIAHATIARSFGDQLVTVGLGLRGGNFALGIVRDDQPTQQLFALSGVAGEAGIVLRPPGRNVRFGATAALPVRSLGRDDPSSCAVALGECQGYIPPEEVLVPFEVGVGIAVRRGGTAWNQRVTGDFRDERALIVAADLLLTGSVERGHGMEAFVEKELQTSGRTTSISLRAGAEYEWLPGKLRVRAGSYFEPGRFDEASGRVHGTAGFDARLWSFCFWGDPYRLRLSLTGDVARAYGNLSVSLGFWH